MAMNEWIIKLGQELNSTKTNFISIDETKGVVFISPITTLMMEKSPTIKEALTRAIAEKVIEYIEGLDKAGLPIPHWAHKITDDNSFRLMEAEAQASSHTCEGCPIEDTCEIKPHIAHLKKTLSTPGYSADEVLALMDKIDSIIENTPKASDPILN